MRYRLFQGVAALSSDSVWGVGVSLTESKQRSLTRHWNGAHWVWRRGPHPERGTKDYLTDVSALARNDVWAVGSTSGGGVFPLVGHWNGSRWRVVPSAHPAGSFSLLEGVAAISSNDVWAVGVYDASYWRTLTEHWNGRKWTVIDSPSGYGQNELVSVDFAAPDDVWAVGYTPTRVGSSPLVEHWDGTQWSVVPTPLSEDAGRLMDIEVIATDDVWAVGSMSGVFDSSTVALHWDGDTWDVLSPANPGRRNYLNGISAITPDDMWAVGVSAGSNNEDPKTMTQHWDGSSWSLVPSPNPGGDDDNYLSDVDGVSASDVWTVGAYVSQTTGVQRTLRLHWDGSAWTVR